jgi:hypothetical protein
VKEAGKEKLKNWKEKESKTFIYLFNIKKKEKKEKKKYCKKDSNF